MRRTMTRNDSPMPVSVNPTETKILSILIPWLWGLNYPIKTCRKNSKPAVGSNFYRWIQLSSASAISIGGSSRKPLVEIIFLYVVL